MKSTRLTAHRELDLTLIASPVRQATLIFVLVILLLPSTVLAQEQALDKPIVSVQVDTAIHLSWNEVPNATSYEVWAWDDEWGNLVDNHSETQFSHITFIVGRKYWYTVRARGENGESSTWSDYVVAIGPQTTNPTPTSTSTLTSSHEVTSAPVLTATMNGAVQLSWSAVDHAQNYGVWRWFADAWEFLNATSSLSYVDDNTETGSTYYYVVAGFSTDETRGPWSNYAKIIVPVAASTTSVATPTATTTPTTVVATPTATTTPTTVVATPTATTTPTTVVATPTATATPTPDPNPERAALISLYHATNGPNWTRNNNWLSNAPLSRWYGVSTNTDGNVTGLVLYGNGLRGSIPPELGNLTSLISLSLDTNELSGTIPNELGKLTNLKQLRLYNNNLAGQMPSEVANLPNLISILLDNDQESLLTLSKGWGENMRAMKRVNGVIVAATNGVSNLAIERVAEIISGMLTSRSDLLAALKKYRTKVILRTVNYRGNPGNASYAPNTNAEYPVIKVIINARSGGLSSMPKPNCETTIHEMAHAIHHSLIESQGCCVPAGPSPPGSQPAPSNQRMNPTQAFDGQLQALYAAAMEKGLWAGQYASTNHYEYWADTVPIWLGVGQFSLADYDPRLAAFIENTLGDDAYVPDYCLP